MVVVYRAKQYLNVKYSNVGRPLSTQMGRPVCGLCLLQFTLNASHLPESVFASSACQPLFENGFMGDVSVHSCVVYTLPKLLALPSR